MILDICSAPGILESMRIVKIALNIIGLIAIILLILFTSLDFLKSIKDIEGFSKVKKGIITKVVAMICIFLVPSLVKLLLTTAGTDEKMYINCINNATPEGIENAYLNVAKDSINIVKNDFSRDSYNYAINSIKDVKNESNKKSLQNELSKYEKYVLINDKINKLKSKYDRDSYKQLYKEINSIKDAEVKEKLLLKYETIKNAVPLNVEPGIYSDTYVGPSDYLDYYLGIPKDVTTNMPILVALHGDGEVSNFGALKSYPIFRGIKSIYGEEYPFILVVPNTRVPDWTASNISSTLKGLIDNICKKYSCDQDTISITGFSRGSIGTWYMVSLYGDYFYKASPVSCPGYNLNYTNFLKVPIRSFVGSNSDDYGLYGATMQNNVNSINTAGGNATLSVLNGYGHGTILNILYDKDFYEWLIS